jgi:hypothetical protein
MVSTSKKLAVVLRWRHTHGTGNGPVDSEPMAGCFRSGPVRYITRPKSRTMRVTRQLMFRPSRSSLSSQSGSLDALPSQNERIQDYTIGGFGLDTTIFACRMSDCLAFAALAKRARARFLSVTWRLTHATTAMSPGHQLEPLAGLSALTVPVPMPRGGPPLESGCQCPLEGTGPHDAAGTSLVDSRERRARCHCRGRHRASDCQGPPRPSSLARRGGQWRS